MSESLTRAQWEALVGEEVGVSDWFPIDQERIDAFADVTLDHQFIHVDPEAARHTPFGSTIAHGFLTLSMLSHLVGQVRVQPEGLAMGINYGFDRVRFLNPVKVDQRIRARARLSDISWRSPQQALVRTDVTVEIDGEDKPAMAAEWLTMAFFAEAPADPSGD